MESINPDSRRLDASERLMRRIGMLIFATAFGVVGLLIAGFRAPKITGFFAREQDRFLVITWLIVLLLMLARFPQRERLLQLSKRGTAALALLVAFGCYLGHHLILMGFDLSRDELMASFDARIFAGGRLAQPLSPEWQADASMLNTVFMFPVERPIAWVSAYLPGNAMLRTAAGWLGDMALVSPIMTGLAVWFTWCCARRLWPDDRETQTITTLLLACSGQVLFSGMTSYAMAALLCFNMSWLLLFLRGRWATDLAALALGLIGTGLHQPLFHPAFAGPFILLLAWRREWGRFVLYSAGYAIICLFWLKWPGWSFEQVVGPLSEIRQGGAIGFAERLNIVLSRDYESTTLMSANLARFAIWSAVPLMPLLIAGAWAERRNPIAWALLAGPVALTALFALVLPNQGHGFGYRYLHGMIGSFALLAGSGWRSLVGVHSQLRIAMTVSLLGGAILLLPLQATMAHRFYATYSTLDRKVESSGADYFALARDAAPFVEDLVRNRPDLSNRPIRLIADEITDPAGLAARLCSTAPGATIALPDNAFVAPVNELLHGEPTDLSEQMMKRLAPAFEGQGCKVVRLR